MGDYSEDEDMARFRMRLPTLMEEPEEEEDEDDDYIDSGDTASYPSDTSEQADEDTALSPEGETGEQADDNDKPFYEKMEPKTDGKFRLNARLVFITAPRCDVPPEYYWAFLRKKFKDAKWRVGQEHHKDGGLHLHALGCKPQGKKFNITSCDSFDIDYKGKSYHMNVGNARVPSACLKYVQKEGFNVCGDLVDTDLPSEGANYAQMLHEVMETEPKGRSAKVMELTAKHAPRVLWTQYRNVKDFSESFRVVDVEEPDVVGPECTEPFRRNDKVEDWINSVNEHAMGRKKLLILQGDTGLGKTAYIFDRLKKEGSTGYCRGQFHLEELEKAQGKKFLIMDDMQWPPICHSHDLSKAVLCSMGRVSLSDKYVKKKTLTFRAGCVFVCNEDPFEGRPEHEKKYWKDNSIHIWIEEPCWGSQNKGNKRMAPADVARNVRQRK